MSINLRTENVHALKKIKIKKAIGEMFYIAVAILPSFYDDKLIAI